MEKYTRDSFPKAILSDKNFYEYLCEYAQDLGDKCTIISDKISYSARQVLEYSEIAAVLLRTHGVKRGDTVAFRMPQTPETIILLSALQIIGALTAFCDPHLGVAEYIKSTGVRIAPDWYLSDENGTWALMDHNFSNPTSIQVGQSDPYDKNEIKQLVSDFDVKSATFLLFTSGTTGKSKGAMVSQYSILNTVLDNSVSGDFREGDSSLIIIPIYHLFAFSIVISSLMKKHVMVFPSNVSIEETFKNIEKYKITRLNAVPTYFLAMADSGLTDVYDISSLRLGYTAGGPYTEEQFRRIESILNCRFVGGYGLSEFMAITISHFPAPLETRAKGVGFVYKNVECVIVNEDNNKLPLMSEGEICVKGYSMMLGYYNDPEATAEIIDGNGYLHTGDLGYLDGDGILYITGRKKDLIVRCGKNLSPFKIEVGLCGLEYVSSASVCGIRDALYGEVPAALVVLSNSAGEITAEQIRQDLLDSKSVIKPELPQKIIFAKELPLLSTGKVDKLKVKEILG